MPLSFLHQVIPAQEDPRGLLHAPHHPCSYDRDTLSAPVRMVDLTADNECLCLTDTSYPVEPAWGASSMLLRARRLLQDPAPEGLLSLYHHYCETLDTLYDLDWGQESYSSMLPEKMIVLLQNYRQKITHLREEQLAWFSSPTAHAAHLALLGEGDPGKTIALGVSMAPALHSDMRYSGTLLLTYHGHPQEGQALVLVLPENLYPHIVSMRMGSHLPGGTTHTHELTDEDTPEVVEVARTLWQPGTPGVFSSLESAFEAARRTFQ